MQNTSKTRRPYWLFVLFATYGPAINFMGQWRYMELVLLVLLFLGFQQALSRLGKLERRFIMLFGLAAAAHILSDIINEVAWQGTARRAGTYIVLIAIIITVQWLSRNDPRRMAFMLAGFSLSFLLYVFAGSHINPAYAITPWRLGLGAAATLFLCVLIARVPRLHHFGGIALIAVAGVHVVMEARSLAAITAVVGVLALLANLRNRRFPPKLRPRLILLFGVLAIVGISLGMQGLKFAVDNRLLPDELQAKMELQMSHPYGMFAAGRSATVAATYAISRRPFLGYGSIAFDAEIFEFYNELTALQYQDQGNYTQMLLHLNSLDPHFAIPSHSHLFGAWVDAGILAAVGWMAFLGLAFYVLARAMFWHHAWSALFVFVALSSIWDVLFSPGPNRVDIALKLMVLAYAVHLFQAFGRMRRARYVPPPESTNQKLVSDT